MTGVQTCALPIFEENNAEITWNEEVKQYYGDYVKDNVTYKMWLEEERSIEEKVKLATKYELKGVAGWKIGLQKKEIWDVLNNYLKKWIIVNISRIGIISLSWIIDLYKKNEKFKKECKKK